MSNELLIGTQLREARLKKNISIDELQKNTKIQKRYLEAIEQGKFEALPGDYYVRAFIRQYAVIVGLDGDELVALFDGKINQISQARPKPEVAGGSRKQQNGSGKKRYWTDFLPMIVLALLALTVLSVVFYISWNDRKSQPYIQSVEPAKSSVQQSSKKVEESKPSETTTPSVEQPKPKEMKIERVASTQDLATMKVTDAKKPFKLTFTGKDNRCWVGVMVNNAYVYQFTFSPGVTQDFTLPENVSNAKIIMGASAFMDIKANDQALDFNDPQFKLSKKSVQLDIAYMN